MRSFGGWVGKSVLIGEIGEEMLHFSLPKCSISIVETQKEPHK